MEKKINDKIDNIKLSNTNYSLLDSRYNSLGDFIESDLNIKVEVYAQGSAQQATLIKHRHNNCFDVDIVVETPWDISIKTQEELKILIGNSIKKYALQNGIYEDVIENKRSWQLSYQHDDFDFHIDITPVAYYSGKYYLTNSTKDNYSSIDLFWEETNPKGFHAWFTNAVEKIYIDKALPLPSYNQQNELQKAIMIIKYLRDKNCVSNEFNSIAITTVCTQCFAYCNTVIELVKTFQLTFQNIFAQKEYKILNPTIANSDDAENFIGKWNKLEESEIASLKDFIDKIVFYFRNLLDEEEEYGAITLSPLEYTHKKSIGIRQKTCEIKLIVKKDGVSKRIQSGCPVPIGASLEFSLIGKKINLKVEKIMWQVTNQYSEAIKIGEEQLRGEIYPPNFGYAKRKESANFPGIHTVQLVTYDHKTGSEIRISNEFIVNISH